MAESNNQSTVPYDLLIPFAIALAEGSGDVTPPQVRILVVSLVPPAEP